MRMAIGRAALANPWFFRQLAEWEQTGSWQPSGSFDERLELMLAQYACLEERHSSARAIILFRKMAHWYLKGMRVPKKLRGAFQSVSTRDEMHSALAEIQAAGPVDGNRSGVLTEVQVPVPKGPVAEW